ncbi:MAG: sensor histidine kinase [Stellaceae bacterium]
MIGTTICRVVQEALANAVRHAEAETVAITVELRSDLPDGRNEISVRIADDGRGMGEETRIGYGLTGLGERIAALGGRLTFSNRPGRGFAVLALLPRRQRSQTVAMGAPEVGS